MNADRLLAHYEQVADAPNAIARLRCFILNLAVRGKLVPQDASEEASSGFRRPDDPSAPFMLPRKWKWIEIGDQLDLLNGMAFKPTDWSKEGLRIIRIQNLNNPRAPFNFCNPALARERSLVDNGSFLISWSGTPGTSFGAFIWDRGPAVLNQHIFRCDFRTKAFVASFLRLAVNGRLDEMIAKAHGGVGLQHITKGKLEALLIPLPPLAEQHRIVAKVDELMDLCDRLEAARAGREAVRDRLAAASLARLNAPNTATFQADARFALAALSAFTTRHDQIGLFRQAILNLAVHGKLAPQDPKDGSASELLTNLHRDRKYNRRFTQLIEDGLEAPLPVLPSGWLWTTIDQISADEENAITDGPFGSQLKTDHYIDAPGFRVIRLQNIGSVAFRGEHRSYIDQDRYQRLSKHHVRAGDLIIAGLVDPNVRCCEVPDDIGPAAVKADCYRLAVHPKLSSRFVLYFLNSPLNQSFAAVHHHGMTLTRIGLGNFRRLPFPLPPIAEQHRIVVKVDTLMALCDRLEASLTANTATRRRLLDALLAEAVATDDASPAKQLTAKVTNTRRQLPAASIDYAERSATVLAIAFERHRLAKRTRTFGHVKAQKILHLVEAEAGFDLGRTPVKNAAGPNDFPHMLATEKWAREKGHFKFTKSGDGYRFDCLDGFRRLLESNVISESMRLRVATISDVFVPFDKEASELFATTYAAWNNLIIEGRPATEQEIIQAARENWHPDKLRYTRERFSKALKALRSSGMIPTGRGKLVLSPTPRHDSTSNT